MDVSSLRGKTISSFADEVRLVVGTEGCPVFENKTTKMDGGSIGRTPSNAFRAVVGSVTGSRRAVEPFSGTERIRFWNGYGCANDSYWDRCGSTTTDSNRLSWSRQEGGHGWDFMSILSLVSRRIGLGKDISKTWRNWESIPSICPFPVSKDRISDRYCSWYTAIIVNFSAPSPLSMGRVHSL